MGQAIWPKTVFVILLLCAAALIASPAPTFTTLLNFDGINGSKPGYMSLVQGIDGDLYGTTYYGGENGSGAIFKITPSGTSTTLHSFHLDGASPYDGFPRSMRNNSKGRR